MTRDEFEAAAWATLDPETNTQTWWSAEWGGFRNLLGLAVILRRWRGDYPLTQASTTGEYIVINVFRFAWLYAGTRWRRLRGRRVSSIPSARTVQR